jgi:MraZ protein
MAHLFGEFEVSLDAKGRFLLPVALRKQLSEAELTMFMVSRGQEPCLSFYTKANWDVYAAKVISKNSFSEEDRMFKRLYFNGATWVEPDTAGRLLIPKTLIEYAQLGKDIVISCMGDIMEIWDSNAYKQLLTQQQSNYNTLSNRVMSNSNSGGQAQ